MKWLFKHGFLLLVIMLAMQDVYGQSYGHPAANNADNEDRTMLTRNEFTAGAVLHSEGWGITLRRGKQVTYKRKKFIEMDIVAMWDAKEVRSQNGIYDNSTSFIYGKMNDLIVTRIGVGRQQVIFAKAHTTGVEVRYHYSLGASLGITKPIYLDILEPVGFINGSEAYTVNIEQYDPVKHTPDVILGNASFTYGLGQLQLHPGGYAKSGVSFEYAKFADQIWSIETGVVVDIYPKAIPIMAFIPNKQVFFNFYVSLSYGGKW